MVNVINEPPDICTHMPFLMLDGTLLYCRYLPENVDSPTGSRLWKLWSLVNGKARRLETGLPEDIVECSPTCWSNAQGEHITFIAGGRGSHTYQLYRMDGSDLQSLSMAFPVQHTQSGFVRGNRMVFADSLNLIHVREPGRNVDLEIPGAIISRVIYRSDAPNVLLISGQWHLESDEFTIEYDMISGDQVILECDGKPAYKCTVFKDKVLCSGPSGPGSEPERIRQGKSNKRIPIDSVIRRQPGAVDPINTQPKICCRVAGEKRGRPTRPSCQECVEKHLGAAYVLLAEEFDGYAHRLRAIGHLVEAEDESQEWVGLHDAIREARKEFQLHGTMPMWNTLGFMVDAIRQSSVDQIE